MMLFVFPGSARPVAAASISGYSMFSCSASLSAATHESVAGTVSRFGARRVMRMSWLGSGPFGLVRYGSRCHYRRTLGCARSVSRSH